MAENVPSVLTILCDERDRAIAEAERLKRIAGSRFDLYEKAIAERDRARHLAKHLFQMIDRQAWRDSGGDDSQGHYEGDCHAERTEEEIRSWGN